MELGNFGEPYQRFGKVSDEISRLISEQGPWIFGQDGGIRFDDGQGETPAELLPFSPFDSGGTSRPPEHTPTTDRELTAV